MSRLFFHLFLALGLIGAAGSGAAAAATIDCAMTAMEGMSEMSGDQGHFDCCTPECALTSPAMAIPTGSAAVGYAPLTQISRVADCEAAPHSVAPEALDPPPRTRLT